MGALATDEQIEFVARALCKRNGYSPDMPAFRGITWQLNGVNASAAPVSASVIPAWNFYIDMAITAIEAMNDLSQQETP